MSSLLHALVALTLTSVSLVPITYEAGGPQI